MKLPKELKDKTILLSAWAGGCETHYQCRDWKPVLKSLFQELIFFNPRDEYFLNGRDSMNKNFIKLVQDKKPDYILFALSYDEFYPQTLEKIRQISPKTQTIAFFGDDNWRFDDWSRYYAPFFDYIITSEKDNSAYFEDGIKNVYFLHGINTSLFSPMKLKKIHDVTFIGSDISDRYDFLKYLVDNGIKVNISGFGWSNHPDLNPSRQILDMQGYVKTTNQTKINLNFSKTFLEGEKVKQFKGRILEISACNSFLLTEDFPKMKSFLKGIVSFRTKEELLNKVRYYLKNEKGRERTSEKIYRQVINNYSWMSQFVSFFRKISKKKIKSNSWLPRMQAKVCIISEKDLISSMQDLKNKIKNSDYISFETKHTVPDIYKNNFQAYSLLKSGKQISCCDYYVHSNRLGNYMLFMAKRSFQRIKKQEFCSLLNLSQIMVTREYFLDNYEKFEKFLAGEKIDIINNKNTVFVSIPLVQVSGINKASYSGMKESFRALFIEKLYSLKYQKKIFLSLYPYSLILAGLFKNRYILEYLLDSFSDKEKWIRLDFDKIG